jgi:hypothetical protein
MRSLGAALVLFALLTAGALAVFCVLRAQGVIVGPEFPLAEGIFALLPAFHLVLALLVFRAGAAMAPVEAQPQELPVRISSPQGKSISGSAKLLAVWSAVTIALVFAFIVSLYPRSWSEAWICAQTGPGETSCDIADGTLLQNALFAIGVTDLSLFALGGPVAFFLLVRDASRTIAMPPSIVELGTRVLLPGVGFDAVVLQHGSGPLRLLSASLCCTESCDYANGSSTSTDTAVVYDGVIAHQESVALERGRPARLRYRGALPAGAMHSWRGSKNAIKWTFVVTAVSASGRVVKQELPLTVGADPDVEAHA